MLLRLLFSGETDTNAVLVVRNNMVSSTPLLDRIKDPADLRQLPPEDLRQLADELRLETISAVSETGGHLGAGLGVVELTDRNYNLSHFPKPPTPSRENTTYQTVNGKI